MTETNWRTRHATLASVVLLISACAHAPAQRPIAQAVQQPVGAVLPEGPSSTYPQAPTPPSAQSPLVVEPSAPPEEPTQVAGLTPAAIVKTTIFLVDINDFATVNGIYAERMGTPPPARSTIGVAALPLGARVEIEAIARARG